MNFLLLIGVVWLALTVMSRLAQRPDEVGRFFAKGAALVYAALHQTRLAQQRQLPSPERY
jgi:hypothetical protein